MEPTPLTPDDLRERVLGITDRVEAGFAVPDGVVYPSRLVAANAAAVEEAGGSVHPHAPLEDLAVEDSRVAVADLGGRVDATVEPEFVVNATGAWAGDVAAMAGVDVEMAPSRGAMLAVDDDALDPVLNRCRDPDDGDIVLPHGDEVVLGTTSVPVDDPDEYEHADWELDRCVEECAAMLPAVADADVTRTWWGVRPLYAPDEADSDRRGISRGFFRLDHADDGVANFASIVGGKLTTYRQMAASTADLVADRLGVDAPSTTADAALPGADDPEQLDAYVERYDARNPSDANLEPLEP
jgi:glycerol-3-phosphate dehydrogenase